MDSAGLRAASLRIWTERSPKARQEFLLQTNQNYQILLEEFFEEANRSVVKVMSYERRFQRWRQWLLIATGLMAVINLIAAYKPLDGLFLGSHLALFAAVYAALLAVLASLESFHKYDKRAQAYRESRELFLDAYRNAEMLWNIHVRPFGDMPEACLNAIELYRRLVVKDSVLRSTMKDLTTSRKGDTRTEA